MAQKVRATLTILTTESHPSQSVSSDLHTHACTLRAGPAQGSTCPLLSLPYLATQGVFLRPDHVAHHVAEVHTIGEFVGPHFIKWGVLV